MRFRTARGLRGGCGGTWPRSRAPGAPPEATDHQDGMAAGRPPDRHRLDAPRRAGRPWALGSRGTRVTAGPPSAEGAEGAPRAADFIGDGTRFGQAGGLDHSWSGFCTTVPPSGLPRTHRVAGSRTPMERSVCGRGARRGSRAGSAGYGSRMRQPSPPRSPEPSPATMAAAPERTSDPASSCSSALFTVPPAHRGCRAVTRQTGVEGSEPTADGHRER